MIDGGMPGMRTCCRYLEVRAARCASLARLPTGAPQRQLLLPARRAPPSVLPLLLPRPTQARGALLPPDWPGWGVFEDDEE